MNISHDQFFVAAVLIFGLILGIVLLIIFFVYKHIKFINLLTRKMENREVDFAKNLVHTRLSSYEQAIQQVGHDLHDDIGQMLLVQNLTVNQLERNLEHPLMPELKQNVLTTIQRVRMLSKTYTSGEQVGQLGLTRCIEDNIAWIQRTTHISIHFHYNQPLPPRADSAEDMLLFRIYQEGMSNALKHSQAREISVHLHTGQGRLQFSLTDDGVGFDPALLPPADRGVGLNSLQVRARELKGELLLTSDAKAGTKISITLPYSAPDPNPY